MQSMKLRPWATVMELLSDPSVSTHGRRRDGTGGGVSAGCCVGEAPAAPAGAGAPRPSAPRPRPPKPVFAGLISYPARCTSRLPRGPKKKLPCRANSQSETAAFVNVITKPGYSQLIENASGD